MKMLEGTHIFEKDNGLFSFLDSGDVFEFISGSTMVNRLQGNPKDGSINNIWLRVYEGQEVKAYPLLGIQSSSKLQKGENILVYTGTAAGVSYTVTFFAANDGKWLWDVALCGDHQTVDLVYGQDLGMGDKGGVLTNELYMSQYLGNAVFKGEHGYVIASRQNQKCSAGFPYLQQGMLVGKAIHYSTDGFQFFGTEYKESGCPKALQGDLEDLNDQYEFSYTALQTEKMQLKEPARAVFYSLFREDHPAAAEELEYGEEISGLMREFEQADKSAVEVKKPVLRSEFGGLLRSDDWTEAKIGAVFPQRKLEERKRGRLQSFFTPEHAHVVLAEKEISALRPHGVIHTTAVNPGHVDLNVLATTNYMFGLFMSQVVVGNTSFHKLFSTLRCPLNTLKNSGVRLYVKRDGVYKQLGVPSAYEMGMNYSRWYYSMGGVPLTVTSFTAANATAVKLEIEAGEALDYILTAQAVMGENEFQDALSFTEEQGVLCFRPSGMAAAAYDQLRYRVSLPGTDYTLSDDSIFFEDGITRNGSLLSFCVNNQKHFSFLVEGILEEKEAVPAELQFEKERNLYRDAFEKLTSGFALQIESESEEIDKLNETFWWYTHNAMIHYSSPHGLEQPGGAAWGTRDVCQGPMEYFLMTDHRALAREVLLTIFAHQESSSGEWPQWFMFDRYPVNAGECHGDVVFWPLKCVADYLRQTGDRDILNERIDYIGDEGKPLGKPETLFSHVKRAVDTILRRFVGDTALVSYAGGDWDDTLQPADPAMKKKLISAWTVALCYQCLMGLGKELGPVDPEYADFLTAKGEAVEKSFSKLLIRDGVIAGFAVNEEEGLRYLLHPSDRETGIRYRLLPLTRSVIAHLVSREQAELNMEIIDRELKCPDGVRLMDHPAAYRGGVSHLFQRAEQAANVGREISLQYTHAHIRYIEAAAKLGMAEEAWDAIFRINPIKLSDVVENALPRQSNLYFSSSDGAFSDRYEYSRDFHKLKEGTVDVRGGWRLYSSGPGIYLNQLVSNVLGIRFCPDGIVIDPVLPERLDGLCLCYNCFGISLRFCYHHSGEARVEIGNAPVPQAKEGNPYRSGGSFVSRELLLEAKGRIDVYYD